MKGLYQDKNTPNIVNSNAFAISPGVIGMYRPTGMRPGRQKYPICLSGRVVHIISRPPFAKTSTQYGGPTVIKSRVMFYPNL